MIGSAQSFGWRGNAERRHLTRRIGFARLTPLITTLVFSTWSIGQELSRQPAVHVAVRADAVGETELVHRIIDFRPAQTTSNLEGAGTLARCISPLTRSDLRILGAQSCAAASCHGGPRPGVTQPRIRGGAYQLWLENDPHARSWRTFCGEPSVRMMRRLGILDASGNVTDQAGYDNCLACHNTTKRFDERRATDTNGFIREGIGCEACHGPGEAWLGNHFQSAFMAVPPRGVGWVRNGDLYTRARMCASCHVGDHDRDMNHDIIAAGHPALRYELATYHASLPKHWRDSEAFDRGRYESQLWLAGQVAAMDASLALLQSRARKAHTRRNTVGVWQDLSAYDCASCHRSLGFDDARPSLEDGRRAVAPRSRWNDSGLRWLIEYRQRTGAAGSDDVELNEALNRVRRLMQSDARPDPAEAMTTANRARTALLRWFDGSAGGHLRTDFRAAQLGQLVAHAAGKDSTFATWEAAAQFYLAAVAARESWPGGPTGPAATPANKLRQGLRYPDKLDISRFASPRDTTFRDEASPMSRQQARRTAIELAAMLGAVSADPPSPDGDRRDDPREQELDELIEKIRQELRDRWPETATNAGSKRQRNEMSETKPNEELELPEPSRQELNQRARQRIRELFSEEEQDGQPQDE